MMQAAHLHTHTHTSVCTVWLKIYTCLSDGERYITMRGGMFGLDLYIIMQSIAMSIRAIQAADSEANRQPTG